MLERLVSVIAPPACAICAAPCGIGDDACDGCIAEIASAPASALVVPGCDRAWAVAAYEGAARRLVSQLKFAGRLRLARVAARAMAAGMPKLPEESVVVPVPADPLRHRLRGFDPAARIAAALAVELRLPLARCLTRRHSRRQVGRSRAERLAGPSVRILDPVPRRVLLVDDVATTGATLAACASELRGSGSEEVLAAAFARA